MDNLLFLDEKNQNENENYENLKQFCLNQSRAHIYIYIVYPPSTNHNVHLIPISTYI